MTLKLFLVSTLPGIMVGFPTLTTSTVLLRLRECSSIGLIPVGSVLLMVETTSFFLSVIYTLIKVIYNIGIIV